MKKVTKKDLNEYKHIAHKLWALLNDIDTVNESYIPQPEKTYEEFYKYAMKKCNERHELLFYSGNNLTINRPLLPKLTIDKPQKMNMENKIVKCKIVMNRKENSINIYLWERTWWVFGRWYIHGSMGVGNSDHMDTFEDKVTNEIIQKVLAEHLFDGNKFS